MNIECKFARPTWNEAPGLLIADLNLSIAGQGMHIFAIEVDCDSADGGGYTYCASNKTWQEIIERLDSKPHPVTLPGHSGTWVVFADPEDHWPVMNP